jgi:hypothetical protein
VLRSGHLFEALIERPFDDSDIDSIRSASRALPVPEPDPTSGSTAFDHLVTSCLEPWPHDRPASARILAETIEAFLDGERARAEREREAAGHARDGERAREAFEALDAEARRLQESAEASLATISPWEPAARKRAAWALAQEGRRLASEAARALARAEAAFTRSLGRMPDPPRRAAGSLSSGVEAAEARGDPS